MAAGPPAGRGRTGAGPGRRWRHRPRAAQQINEAAPACQQLPHLDTSQLILSLRHAFWEHPVLGAGPAGRGKKAKTRVRARRRLGRWQAHVHALVVVMPVQALASLSPKPHLCRRMPPLVVLTAMSPSASSSLSPAASSAGTYDGPGRLVAGVAASWPPARGGDCRACCRCGGCPASMLACQVCWYGCHGRSACSSCCCQTGCGGC